MISDMMKCHDVDIVELRDFVDKHVRVSIKGGKFFEGIMHTVDPVSGCVILVNKSDNSVDLVFGHAVEKITVINNTVEPIALFEKPSISDESAKEKQTKLKNWLLQNRIPIEADGDDLKLGETLTIIPPYNSDCCLSTNEIVLANVQRLILSMPSV